MREAGLKSRNPGFSGAPSLPAWPFHAGLLGSLGTDVDGPKQLSAPQGGSCPGAHPTCLALELSPAGGCRTATGLRGSPALGPPSRLRPTGRCCPASHPAPTCRPHGRTRRSLPGAPPRSRQPRVAAGVAASASGPRAGDPVSALLASWARVERTSTTEGQRWAGPQLGSEPLPPAPRAWCTPACPPDQIPESPDPAPAGPLARGSA